MGVGEIVGARRGEGGEGGGVSNGGWGEASSLRHFLRIRVPRWRWGLVSKPQELRQIPPTAFRERRAGGGGRGHAKGARRHGKLQPAVGGG